MKRFILCILILFCSIFFTIAQESHNFSKGLSLGGLWYVDNQKAGGEFEIGIPLISHVEKGFLLRNHFIIGGFGSASLGQISFGNKILIGAYVLNNGYVIKPYGFLGANVGIFSSFNKSFFDFPLFGELEFGGGFEFQFIKTSSFIAEFGGKWIFPVGKNSEKIEKKSSPNLRLGYRMYF